MNANVELGSGSILIAGILLFAQLLASIHILQSKDEVRSAIAWIGLVWLAPLFGIIAYLLFGVSRIRRRARLSRIKRGLLPRSGTIADPGGPKLLDALPDTPNRWQSHARLAGRIAAAPLTVGNEINPLEGGREAYDAMLEAIDSAQHTVHDLQSFV